MPTYACSQVHAYELCQLPEPQGPRPGSGCQPASLPTPGCHALPGAPSRPLACCASSATKFHTKAVTGQIAGAVSPPACSPLQVTCSVRADDDETMTEVCNLLHRRERQEEKAQFKKQRPWRDPKEDSSLYDGAAAGDDDVQMRGHDCFRRNLRMGWVTPSPFNEVFPLSFKCEPVLSITSSSCALTCPWPYRREAVG